MSKESSYQDIKSVKQLLQEKNQLAYDARLNETNQEQLINLLSFLTNGHYENVEFKEIKKSLRQEINRLTSILNLFNSFPELKNKEELNLKINELVAEKQSMKSIAQCEIEIEETLKHQNICQNCYGKTTIYDVKSAIHDPYARSSDYQKTCPLCKGSGNYVEPQSKLH